MTAKQSIWDDFTNIYSIEKTLRFELKPVGKTLEHIHKEGLIGASTNQLPKRRLEELKTCLQQSGMAATCAIR